MFFFMTFAVSAGAGALSISPFLILMEILARKQIPMIPLRHLLGSGLFALSLSAILAAADVPAFYEMRFNPSLSLIPFAGFSECAPQYLHNILLFLPVGLLLPLLYRKFRRLSRCALYGALLALAIELMHLLNFNNTDINSLLMNVLGTLAGYGIFALFEKLYPPVAEDFSISPAQTENLHALFGLEVSILTAAAWMAALFLIPAFKSVIWTIFL